MDDTPLWQRLLNNRFTITFGILFFIILLWNLYVLQHDDGILSGRVVSPDGKPVADAVVVLSERTIVSLTPLLDTTTDANGDFHFNKHDRHYVVLTASKDGIGSSDRYPVRLYFRNQNRQLNEPLRLQAQN